MKAIRIRAFGGPEEVRVEEVPVPEIEAGQALVRVRAAGVNPVDWLIREHVYNPAGADRVPLTLGQDFAGVIEALAADSQSDFAVGDEVFGETWGAFAELAAVPVADLVAKPKSLDFVVAASIPMASLTAWQMVVDTADARAGLRFLIHGASGGVGSFAAQFARWKGAEVIATASRLSFAYLHSIGVGEIIDYANERFEEKLKDLDVVIDPLGGEVQARSWGVLKRGGMLINLIGEIDEEAAAGAGVQAIAFEMRYDTEDLREIAGLIERGLVKPHISQVLSLDDARQALDLNQQNRSHGKIVLRVA
jgi:NADPH:quinone reductase-like Zn-dependent oxidoreductase